MQYTIFYKIAEVLNEKCDLLTGDFLVSYYTITYTQSAVRRLLEGSGGILEEKNVKNCAIPDQIPPQAVSRLQDRREFHAIRL